MNEKTIAPKEPTHAMIDAGAQSIRCDVRFQTPQSHRARAAARNAYVSMLAKAPAAEAPDEAIKAWAERHGLDGLNLTDARCAFEDAQTFSPNAELNGARRASDLSAGLGAGG